MIKPLSKIHVIKGEGKISADTEGILVSFGPDNSTFAYASVIITKIGKRGKPRIANHVIRIPYYTEKEIKEMFPLAKQQEIAMKCLQNVNTSSIESLDLEKRILTLTNLDFLAYITAKSRNLGALLNAWRIVVQAEPGRTCVENTYSQDEETVRNSVATIFSQCPIHLADLILACSNQDHLEHRQHGFRFAILENIVSKPDMRDCIMKELYSWEAKYAKIIDKDKYNTSRAFAAKAAQFVAKVKEEANKADRIINTPEPTSEDISINRPAQSADSSMPRPDMIMLEQDLIRVNVPNDKIYTVWMRSELPEDLSYRYPDITIISDPRKPYPDRSACSYIANFIRGCDINPDGIVETRINNQLVYHFPGIIRIPVHYSASLASNEGIRAVNESARIINEFPPIRGALQDAPLEPIPTALPEQGLLHINVENVLGGKTYLVWPSSFLTADPSYVFPDITIILDPGDLEDNPKPSDLSYIANYVRNCDVSPYDISQIRIDNQMVYHCPGVIRMPFYYMRANANPEVINAVPADRSDRLGDFDNSFERLRDRMARERRASHLDANNLRPPVTRTVHLGPRAHSATARFFECEDPYIADVEQYALDIDESEDEDPIDLASIGLADQLSSTQFLEDSQAAANETGLVEEHPSKCPHIPENSEFTTTNRNVYALSVGSTLFPGLFTYSDVSIKRHSLSNGSSQAIARDLLEMIEYFTGKYVDPMAVKNKIFPAMGFSFHYVPGLIRLVEKIVS